MRHTFFIPLALLLLVSGVLPLATAGAQEKSAKKKKAASTRAEAPPGKEYVYKTSGGVPQTLEVYFPENWEPAAHKAPGIIFFHGGGWSGGDLSQFRYACRYFASRGLVAATVNYRMLKKPERETLAEGESYKRACVTDAKSAIRWYKQHAAELGIDPERILTGGGSAGGHISVLSTTNPGLNDPADPSDIDTNVVAYLLFNPAFTGQDKVDAQIDVLQHLKASFAPAILFFGDMDNWKPGADAAYAKLKELGNTTTEMWIAPGESHGFFNGPPWQDITITAADRFLVRLGLLSGEPTLPPPPEGQKLVKAP